MEAVVKTLRQGFGPRRGGASVVERDWGKDGPMSFIEVISPIEDVIEDARNGRMFILVDDEDRENEGDLVIPAEKATPDAVNFMAKHGRGLICLSMTEERCAALGLEPMAPR